MNNPLKIITMKKYLLSFALVLSASIAFGQTNYEKTMAEKIAKLEKSRTADEFQSSSDDFVRILGVESGQWLPYYYSAHALIEKGRNLMRTGNLSELDAIAACVVGGVSFSGGVGTVVGVVTGVIIFTVINYGLTYIGVNPYWQYIIKGAIIIFAVALDSLKYARKK